MRRAPEIVELYQALTRHGEASRQTGSRGPKAPASGSKGARSDLMGRDHQELPPSRGREFIRRPDVLLIHQ
jgi:hypothetical protein